MYFIVLLAIMTFVSATKVFTEKDQETMQIIPVGETIRIELETNPSTGYSWKLRELDSRYFELLQHGYMPPVKIQPGSPYTEFWEIKTIGKGFTFIYLFYNTNTCESINMCAQSLSGE